MDHLKKSLSFIIIVFFTCWINPVPAQDIALQAKDGSHNAHNKHESAFHQLQDSTFNQQEITLNTATGIIKGTLTIPKGKKSMPVALIIAGSGPTDRNGNNPMMKNNSLQMIAFGLAENGIASLRYDKRGIAASRDAGKSEINLRFEDYINDARSWLQLLDKDKRFTSKIVIGHSEGSLIGMIAAKGNADGFVSVAGAGSPADVVLKEQLQNQPPVIRDTCFKIIDQLKAGKTLDSISPLLYSLFRPAIQPYMISWFKYDPQAEIKKLSIPVLILQGTTDIQVTEEDAKLLKAANEQAQLKIIDSMNHVLKFAPSDRNKNIAVYNDPSLPLANGVIEAIVDFTNKIK